MPDKARVTLGTALGSLSLTVLALLAPASARAQAEPRPSPAEACAAKLRQVAQDYGVEPKTLIETASERTVQFRTAEASVIVICNKTNGGVITTATPYVCRDASCRQKPPEAAPTR